MFSLKSVAAGATALALLPRQRQPKLSFVYNQFMVIQLIGLILIFIFPQIVLWLPNQVFGS